MKQNYDVIVVGGGPSGIGAAIGAARAGADVLLIEQYGFAGGMWTAGLVNPVFDHANKGGVLAEIIGRLQKEDVWGGFIDSCFQYEPMKWILDEMLAEAGVTPLYHTMFSEPVLDGDRVTGVVVENKDGRTLYAAKWVIDCTGDADVAARAGVPCVVGRPEDGKCQAMTLMFLLGNIEFMQGDCNELYGILQEALAQHPSDYEIPFTRPYVIQIPNARQAVVQLTHIRGKNVLSAEALTEAEIEGRRQVRDTVRLMKKHPLFKDVELLYTAPQIGVRDSRRIVGKYTLTAEDCAAGRQFEDGVTVATFGIDIHNPDNDDQTCLPVKPYEIPMRCMIPVNREGLLVSGRCISGDFAAQASYRVTGNCVALGEAAGRYAAERLGE